MPSRRAAKPAVKGSQTPRLSCAPAYARSTGAEAVELAAMAGLVLDPWQQEHLTAALGETDAGRWVALEVGLVMPRQNGKNSECEARQLAGLFLLEEPLQIHSAHLADTSIQQFRRLEALIEGAPELSRRVKKFAHGKGSEEIVLHRHPRTGVSPRLEFRTRTGSGGRGFSCDCLYLDEAMILSEAFHGNLMPTLSARPNPQVWYTGSAGDQEDPAHQALVLARLRERAQSGDDQLVYAEWSLDVENPAHLSAEEASDVANWALVNPAFGVRITADYIAVERRSMGSRQFAVERLGVGDWPDTSEEAGRPIAPAKWDACEDAASKVAGPVVVAYDVSPDRSSAAVVAAGAREDEKVHVEVVKHARGVHWVAPLLERIVAKSEPYAVIADVFGGAGSLVPDIEGRYIEVTAVNTSEHAQACGMIFDAVEEDRLRHLGQPALKEAIMGATKRPMTDRWAWSRKDSTVDIAPLVAATLALWGVVTLAPSEPTVIDLNEIAEEMRAEGEDFSHPYA